MKTDQYIDGSYLEKTKDWHEGDAAWKAANVLRMIEKNHLSPGLVFDIGCGAGGVLSELLQKLNPKVHFAGFDISPQAIALARQKEESRLTFHNIDFLAAQTEQADLLLLLDVMEHVPDYLGFLESLKKRTEWIIFHIPLEINVKGVIRKSNWMLHMREKYGHLHYFTQETAIATISDAGFTVVDTFITDDTVISEEMIPKQTQSRIIYEIRKLMLRIKPDLAVALFDSFNLMLLARGDRQS